MPTPTNSDVHVDSALTNISIAFLQSATMFVAGRVFPNVPVQKQSDRYFIFDRGDFNRDEAEVRAPGAESAGSGYGLDNTPTYFCDVVAFHQDIPAQVRANADAAVDVERAAAEFVMHKMLIQREKNWATTYLTGGVWTNDYDGVASSAGSNETIQWSDGTNGDPIGDIRAAMTTVQQSTGFRPNTLVVGQEVFDALEDHPDIVDRVKYATSTNENPARVNETTLAALFGLSRVMVMGAIENTAGRELADSHAFIGGKKALLCYAAPAPSLMAPTAGYTFSWTNYLNAGNALGIATSRFDGEAMELKRAVRVEAEMAYDQKLVSADLGFFWDSIVA